MDAAADPTPDDVIRRLRGAPWRRLMLAWIVAALLLVMIALVAYLNGNNTTDERGGQSAAIVAPSPSESPTPGPGPTPSASATNQASAAPSPAATSPSRSSPQPRFGPVTFEAEAPGNAVGGSAFVTKYPGASGGGIVRNLGNWDSRQGVGFLRFEDVTVPSAGTYTLKVFHVNLDNERTRTAVVTVSGQGPQQVTTTGSSTCCSATSVRVSLRKGRNSITIGNDAGHAPSVDRIVVSLP